MTTPIYPNWPTISSAPTRRPSVAAADDPQAAGPGLPSDSAGTDAYETVLRAGSDKAAAFELADPGRHGPVGDYLLATAESQSDNEVTVVDRDRAIAAFTDIMRMQI
jgi:hypothetical protein